MSLSANGTFTTARISYLPVPEDAITLLVHGAEANPASKNLLLRAAAKIAKEHNIDLDSFTDRSSSMSSWKRQVSLIKKELQKLERE